MFGRFILPGLFAWGLCIGALCVQADDRPAAAMTPTINLRHTVTVDVVRRTKDAVVNVSTTKVVNQRVSPFGRDPYWQQFDFGTARVPATSLGSGFIVHPDGYVVTNHHVVDRARQITVELADGRKLPAALLSSDPDADLALLKINSDKPFPALEMGDSSDLMIGEPVIAVGNPMGYSHSVSTGIVSALHRDLKDTDEKVMLGDLVQTDAAINPGNSGGPLLNAYGQVIGINTAIRGDAQNIGFAIQVNKLRDLVPELMNPAHVTRVDVPLKMKETRVLTPPANVECRVFKADGPNAPQITLINGQAPRNIVDAYAIILKARDGGKITLTFAGDKTEAIVAAAVPQPDAIVQARKKLGIGIEEMTPMLAERYHLSTEDGLLILEVTHGSVCARAGLQPGDVILQVGRYRVSKLQDMAVLLQHLPASGRVRFGIIRGNQVGFATLVFGEG